MRKIVLANSQYANHMTDEGLQLQEGLKAAGWQLRGHGYEGGERDVRRILDEDDPDYVFVQDKRDWDYHSRCPGVLHEQRFQYISSLRKSRARVAVVVKDGGPDGSGYHREFVEEVDADAVAVYYHPLSLFKYSPWLASHKLIRTYHSIKAEDIPIFTPGAKRRPLLGSGALLGDVYPFRKRVAMRWKEFNMVWLQHPGYVNEGKVYTPGYLQVLNSFKIHFATASSYGFALRKIIESVACGCVVVTDLPSYDVLPVIDRAIVRVKPNISDYDLMMVFKEQEEQWNEDGRRKWAQKAIEYYDYRAIGKKLSNDLARL